MLLLNFGGTHTILSELNPNLGLAVVYAWSLSYGEECRAGGFGGLVVSMLSSGTQDRGFAPGRSRRIFRAKKFLSMPSFGREVKPFAPCHRFAACKRTL
jgi:hypothetical protein